MRCAVHIRSRLPRYSGLLLLAMWFLGASALAAGPAASPLSPLLPVYEDHKRAILAMEADLRNAADVALTGVPGMAVVLLRCEAAGCVGPQTVRWPGQDAQRWRAATLPTVFIAGGELAVAVDKPFTLTWQGDRRSDTVAVPLPGPGRVVVLSRQGDGVVVRERPVSEDDAWRVALAHQALGDPLTAVAVLQAARRVLGHLSAPKLLLLADLLAQSGLPDLAAKRYANGVLSDPLTADRAALGRARVAFGQAHYADALSQLDALFLDAAAPLANAVNDLKLRVYLKLGRVGDAVAVPQAGTDPFLDANRAVALMADGQPGKAIGAIDASLNHINRSVPVETYLREHLLVMLALVYSDQHRLDDALEVLEQVSREGPLGDRYRFARGLVFFDNHELIKAVVELQALGKEYPDSPYSGEGRLVLAEAYRQLNAPRQAVKEYRRALDLFQTHLHTIDTLLESVRTQRFDSGLTGLLFALDWRRNGQEVSAEVRRGLQILLHTEGIPQILAQHRQINRRLIHFRGVRQRLLNSGQKELAARVGDGLDRLLVFETMFQATARQIVMGTLQGEHARIQADTMTASLGITQSVLFDTGGGVGAGLIFGRQR